MISFSKRFGRRIAPLSLLYKPTFLIGKHNFWLVDCLLWVAELYDFHSSLSLFQSGPVCPDGWVLHVNSCFLVIDIPTLEWSDARRNCQKLGGDLAKITSSAENQFILDLVTKQKKVADAGVWLGLHRKADNKFYWADDTLLAGYSNWHTGEPNNVAEKCAHMYSKGSARGKWNDLICTRQSNSYAKNAPVVLCQKKAKH